MSIPIFRFTHTNPLNISNTCLRHHRVFTMLGPINQPLKFFFFPNPANISCSCSIKTTWVPLFIDNMSLTQLMHSSPSAVN